MLKNNDNLNHDEDKSIQIKDEEDKEFYNKEIPQNKLNLSPLKMPTIQSNIKNVHTPKGYGYKSIIKEIDLSMPITRK